MSLADHIRELTEGIPELIGQHFKLARLEAQEDAKHFGVQAGRIAAFLPLVVIGYALLCVAGGFALARVVPADLAFLIVALVNLGGGVGGILWAVNKLKTAQPPLNQTMAAIERTSKMMRELPPPQPNGQRHLDA